MVQRTSSPNITPENQLSQNITAQTTTHGYPKRVQRTLSPNIIPENHLYRSITAPTKTHGDILNHWSPRNTKSSSTQTRMLGNAQNPPKLLLAGNNKNASSISSDTVATVEVAFKGLCNACVTW